LIWHECALKQVDGLGCAHTEALQFVELGWFPQLYIRLEPMKRHFCELLTALNQPVGKSQVSMQNTLNTRGASYLNGARSSILADRGHE
jgi:hypothetical protein